MDLDPELEGRGRLYTPRSVSQYVAIAARGFCMGSADVVPGVSGGTMAFILGIYEELIESIRSFGQPELWKALGRLDVREAARISNFAFLAALLTGIGAAVLTLARAMEWALENHPVYVWAFFFGLVVASVLSVAKRVQRWNAMRAVSTLLSMVGAYLLVGLVPLQTPNSWWFLFLAGALAICAMILPGISGAFILLLLGKYHCVLAAVNDRNLMPIVWVGLGAVVGIVSFAQVLGWLFRRYHDTTVAALTGLMIGSLRKVWPWKVDLQWMAGRHGERLPTVQENVLPDLFLSGSLNAEIVIAAALAAGGFAAVLILDAWAARSAGPELQPGS